MKVLKYFVDFFTGKRGIIRETVDGSGMYLLNRVSTLENRGAKAFYHQSIICCIADAFEYFLEIDTNNNVFYQNISSMTALAGEKFIMWEAAYHTLQFTKNQEALDTEELEKALFTVFEATDDEKNKYAGFKATLAESEAEFIVEFSNSAVSDIFNISELNSLDTSFIYNFYHSCYTEFYRLYTKFTCAESTVVKDSDDLCLDALQMSK